MRNLLALLGLALVAFLGVGYYLDWYNIAAHPSGAAGHQRIEIDINTKKVGEDVHRGVRAGTERLQNLLDRDNQPTAPRP
jgi:hypothetical protein